MNVTIIGSLSMSRHATGSIDEYLWETSEQVLCFPKTARFPQQPIIGSKTSVLNIFFDYRESIAFSP